MDLGTVKKKFEERKFADAREFSRDMKLVFANCMAYNAVGCCETKSCSTIQRDLTREIIICLCFRKGLHCTQLQRG